MEIPNMAHLLINTDRLYARKKCKTYCASLTGKTHIIFLGSFNLFHMFIENMFLNVDWISELLI